MLAGLDDLALWADFLDEEDAATMLRLDPGSEYGSLAPVTFPATQLRIRVELLLGGTWTDVSQYVLYERRLVISRGRAANQRRSTAASLALTFKNADQRFSPRNVMGPYFGLLRQNTPIRVYLNPGSGDSLRFTGNVPSWVPKLRGHPNDRRVPIIAYGVRNRLERPDNPPLQSAQRRYLGSLSTLAYRSLEDDEAPGRVTGPDGSGDLPDLARGGVWTGSVDAAGSSTSYAVEVDVKFPLGKEVVGTDATALTWYSTGTVGAWRLVDDSSGVGIIYYTSADGVAHTVRSSINGYDGLWHHYRVTATQNGTGIDIVLYQDGTSIMTTTLASSTLGGNTFYRAEDTNPAGGAERMPAVGHIVFYSSNAGGPSSYAAYTGWTGETPAARFLRLCGEEGISATVDELIVDQILMGPQRQHALPRLLTDCEDAADGFIDETFANQLRLSTARSRYNREVALVIDYAAGDVLPPFEPADDNESLRNKWTLTRPGGGEGSYERTTGPLNSSDPENDVLGVGLYSDSAEVNIADVAGLYAAAGWRVHRDTVDEPRYPAVEFNLAASPTLVPGWLDCDVGSRVLISGGPDDVGQDDPDGILEGYIESFDQVSWDVVAHLEPASVYRVGAVGPSGGYSVVTPRLDCAGSALTVALDDTATIAHLVITDSCVWTHSYGDYPVTIDGEDVIVTGVGGIDEFDSRLVSSGWGTADNGSVWTTTGGSAADYSVTGI